MTPDDLDALAVVQASIRACYEIAAARTHLWEPAPPPPLTDVRQLPLRTRPGVGA